MFCASFRHIQYNDLSNRVFGWSMEDAPKEHKKKTTLLMYFAQYMDEHLIHGGDMLVKKDERQTLPPAIFMKKWFRTNRAIVMYLNNGTLQVMISPDYGLITLAVSGTGTRTGVVPVQVQCERFYVKPYNPIIHVSHPFQVPILETASVIRPSFCV